MIDWNKELEKIFADPLLADVTVPTQKQTSSDRLIAGFQKICDFLKTHNRLPQNCNDREERSLYNQLQGILKDANKIERCKPYDTMGIFQNQTINPRIELSPKECSLEDILSDPLIAETNENTIDLFQIPSYMQQRMEERKEADYIAQRKQCPDFDKYEIGFKEIHQGLKSGKYRLIKFKEAHISQNRYYLDDGIIVYIASLEHIEKNRHGRKNSRTRCIYENGMESDIYMQTLCKNLYRAGYSIQDTSELDSDFLKKAFTINEQDVESGLIYVLRSLSKDPQIASIPNLYKIGITTTSLESRLKNARNEPTYLCADVEVVATWKVYNVKTSVFESLLHKLFGEVQLQIKVDGKNPKEWFCVPFQIIEQAILYIINNKPISYNSKLQAIIDLS